jgi:hypothetical protein
MANKRRNSAVSMEWLEARRLLTSTMAASGGEPVTFTYAGTMQGLEYDPHQVDVPLYAPVEEVSVTSASSGGPAPTGTATFYLDGHLAGYASVGPETNTFFQANPGTYTLTAHYSGDQTYAPADLPATTISIPKTLINAPVIGPGGTASSYAFSVFELSGTGVVSTEGSLQDSFFVNVTDAGSSVQQYFITASVYLSPVDDPQNQVLLEQVPISGNDANVSRQGDVTLSLNVPLSGFQAGSYVLSYVIGGNGFANIYSERTITISSPQAPSNLGVSVGSLKGLPTPLVGGKVARGSAVVTITNDGDTSLSGRDTIDLYASNDGAIDASSTLLGSSRAAPLIRPGRHASVAVPIKSFATAGGSYVVLARVTNAAVDVPDATSGPIVTVADPSVQLAGTVTKVSPATLVPGRAMAFTLTLTNSGNIASTGQATLAVYLSADGTTHTTTVGALVRPSLAIRPGKSVTLRLAFKMPTTAMAGTAYPLVLVTQGEAMATVVATTAVTIG